MRAKHGGDWYGFQAKYGRLPLDYSANVSPFPTPKNIRKAISLASQNLAAYPDPECRLLRRAIAEEKADIPARVIRSDGTVEEILLHAAGLTADEREILLDGCLMNYYAAGYGKD